MSPHSGCTGALWITLSEFATGSRFVGQGFLPRITRISRIAPSPVNNRRINTLIA